MADINDVRQHMDVIDFDGHTIGKVDSVDGTRIKLTRRDSPDGQHHYVDASDIARVDSHVHLLRSGSAIFGTAAGLGAGAAAGAATYDSTPHHHDDRKKTNWLPWVLGGAALLALLAALSQCDDRDAARTGTDPVATATTTTTTTTAVGAYATGTTAFEVDRYLAGAEAAPRTFQFQNLNFDSGAATIRDADQSDLNDIARVLNAYPQARAAVVGYTDAEGPAASNTELGAERARAVIAALGERGVAADRLEARTGGESDPEASNANDGGKFANRRTELVILSR
ncbi:DUF2171 domain-containing protein [Qipengyuania sediminis]|uniref:DUF2171 domain-containing protein n=1 Tax=Qipengyuania sediminis TaxID=1532023 RepID=UPI001059F257|nr:DUF2171 domain-containing protein [Qipengyuania sediminis]